MEVVAVILIALGVVMLVLFLYALMKVAHESDVRAGYGEGMLYELPDEEKTS